MKVDGSNSPAALIVPGDYVDVLGALDISDFGQKAPLLEEGEAEEEGLKGAGTLFQNLRVLAVQRDYVDQGVPVDASIRGAPTAEGGTTMTFAVTPEQAQLFWLWLAKDVKMTVTLRPYGDDRTEPLNPVMEPILLDVPIEPIVWSDIPYEGLP